MSDIPAMPWHLEARGITPIALCALERESARAFVPPRYTVLPCWPGRTMGGLFLAEYGPGSELEYSELIVVCATVLYRGRPAAWASHLFVDSARSLEGGRRMLGAPKQLASFAREGGEGVSISVEGRPVCRIRHRRPLWLWRQRLRLAALHRDARDPSGVVAHGNELRGRLGLLRVSVEVPAESPLAALGFGPPRLGLCIGGMEALLGGAPFLPARREPPPPEGSG